MRKGQMIFAEESLSLLMAFLATILLFSSFFILNKRTYTDIADERMFLVADNIADSLVKKYVDSAGNLDLTKLNATIKDKVEVAVGGAHFGSSAPDNVNVYSVRRLVFVDGQPSQMEVKVWP
ncbi:hypothetical protein H0N98_03190 [Candidatus Micrarchaeota archaeon]|nr:hypothetical protein [Candidatus Micrarchaeota archaeon]